VGSRVKKDRRASGEAHAKPVKVPTGPYVTKKDAKARRRRSAQAEARAFAAAAAAAPAMWQAMSASNDTWPRGTSLDLPQY
jgi:hypothetical protein